MNMNICPDCKYYVVKNFKGKNVATYCSHPNTLNHDVEMCRHFHRSLSSWILGFLDWLISKKGGKNNE